MRRGFSLVELSIVLVILGLLTGGILAGQSLIKAASLRGVGTDYTRYTTAVRSFRDKYFAIPGDMSNATSFWGSLGGTGSDAVCQVISATSAATCNGDGDGSLLWGGSPSSYETNRFWQHLANAGLVEGQYTGVGASNVPGTNVPLSKIPNNYFYVNNGLNYTTSSSGTVFAGSTRAYAGDYGKSMFVYSAVGAAGLTPGSLSLTPEDAWNIDTKLDDGNPGTGVVMSNKGNGGAATICTSLAGVAPPDAASTYSLSNTSKDCALYFVRAF